jgi:hypothetical protein
MNEREMFEYIKLSSIPLKKLDKNRMPIGLASGCLINYNQKRIILSVQHATGDMGNWAAEIKYEYGKGTQLYQLGAMNFLASFSITTFDIRDIDFSYVSVPNDFVSFFQEIRPNGQIISETLRHVCKVTFDSEPDSSELYGFSGQVMPSLAGNQFITKHRVYLNLKCIGSDDDFYIFELPLAHPGHKHFQGCSGAPIIDTHGNAVALVCKGDTNTNRIFGISLKRYKVAIDATYGDLSKNTLIKSDMLR